MINVLHLRDTDRVCGPGKTIIETACAADARQFRHVIGLFLLQHERDNQYQKAATDRGVEVVPLRSRHQYDPRIIGTILRTIKTHRIDIIHSHEYKSDILAWVVSRLHPIPVMSTVHGWIRNSAKAKAYIRAGQLVLNRVDRVIAVSDETKAAVLASGVSADKVVVIHNGIVASRYRVDEQEPGFIRARYALPEGARVVGCIGRLSPEKGQRDLLVAAAEIVRARQDVWFAFVGDGPDRAALEAHAHASGIADRVLFTGHVSDVRPAFRDLDILALTSHTEGFPNVVLEALCMERPVVATDVGGVAEIIEDGVTGTLLQPHAPAQAAAALLAMLDRPEWARGLAAAGRERVLRQFTFERRVAKEEEVCRQILASRNN